MHYQQTPVLRFLFVCLFFSKWSKTKQTKPRTPQMHHGCSRGCRPSTTTKYNISYPEFSVTTFVLSFYSHSSINSFIGELYCLRCTITSVNFHNIVVLSYGHSTVAHYGPATMNTSVDLLQKEHKYNLKLVLLIFLIF